MARDYCRHLNRCDARLEAPAYRVAPSVKGGQQKHEEQVQPCILDCDNTLCLIQSETLIFITYLKVNLQNVGTRNPVIACIVEVHTDHLRY